MAEHRFSGWPGAYCLNCGSHDPDEEALAHDCLKVDCIYCGISYPQDEECTKERESLPLPNEDELTFFWPHEVSWDSCGQHGSYECSHPVPYPDCVKAGCDKHPFIL